MLSVRCLQKTIDPSIYKNAEIGKTSAVAKAMADGENVFKEFDHGWHVKAEAAAAKADFAAFLRLFRGLT